MLAEPQWEQIESTVFAWEDNCWLTCGGYCCGTTHPEEFQFRILPLDASAIVYLGDEYDWMEKNGKAPPPDMRKREFVFDFGGPKPLRMVVVDCHLKGLCAGCVIKPLQCRIYPFIPIFDLEGELQDLYPGSMYDLTFSGSEDRTPCTVWHSKRDSYLERWRSAKEVEVLKHPLLMFYFAAYKIFADIYLEMLGKDESIADLKGAEYWSRWEMLYLGRKLFDAPRLRRDIHALYLDYRERFGDFMGE